MSPSKIVLREMNEYLGVEDVIKLIFWQFLVQWLL